jgi:hypothetical protein
VLIYRGLLFTSASRAAVFLYTAPFFCRTGLVPFPRRTFKRASMGRVGAEFARVALAIGVPQADVDAQVLLGDLMVVGGGALGRKPRWSRRRRP